MLPFRLQFPDSHSYHDQWPCWPGIFLRATVKMLPSPRVLKISLLNSRPQHNVCSPRQPLDPLNTSISKYFSNCCIPSFTSVKQIPSFAFFYQKGTERHRILSGECISLFECILLETLSTINLEMLCHCCYTMCISAVSF